jgi:hypothetical protein
MIHLRPEDAIHKSYLNRLLIEIIDEPYVSHVLALKGGTCASMLGYLDRFSVDLDFDVSKNTDERIVRKKIHTIVEHLGLTATVKKIDSTLLFQIRYPGVPLKRNTIKMSVNMLIVKANHYAVQYFPEIDRLMNSQTIETMFANKLVAVTDRYASHRTIAGRDIYDIHHFFIHGYAYTPSVITERTGLPAADYFEKLESFIKRKVTQVIINEDLNTLLSHDQFQAIRKVVLPETLQFLERERMRMTAVEHEIQSTG